MSGVISAASRKISNVAFGTPFQYNSNYPSKFIAGDTFFPTVGDDGKIYTPHCDTFGWEGTQGAPQASANMAVSSISTFDSSTVGTLVNGMSAFGAFNTTGADGKTYKNGGLISVSGDLLLFACREAYGNSSNGFLQTSASAQLIKSTDHGVTWAPLPPSTNAPYASPMFTSPKFGIPGFIQYGQDYQGNVADNSATYVYAIGSSNWNNGSSYYLGRVAVAAIKNQSAADWSFYIGGDGMLDASWDTNISNAVPIVSSPSALGQTSGQYVAAFGCYVMFGWYYPSIKNSAGVTNTTSDVIWNVYVSEKPWGPWELVQSKEWSPQGYYNPVIIPTSVIGNTAVAVCAGDYTTFASYPTSPYTLTLVPVTFS